MKLEFSEQTVIKYLHIRFYEPPSSGVRVVPCRWMDRQTGRHDKANCRFSQFCEHA
jgi:hypothetical protein